MPGIRLHPNYHGYTLADPRCKRLLGLATERGLLVQLAVQLEDFRTHHPLLQVADVDAAPLVDLMTATPKARVLLLNSGKVLESALGAKLAATPGVSFDIARIEAAGSVGRHLRKLPPGRLVFGTHAPLFIYEAAVIKLYESALTDAETRALLEENPRRLLRG
jgi:predicted TIM-barrel fold metal-dependent hydrolase